MIRTIRSNPLIVIALAAAAGWLLGSGVFAIPGFGAAAPAPHEPAAGSLPASSSSAATLATSSASMPGAPGPDVWGGYDI